jgi:hypothetical protein
MLQIDEDLAEIHLEEAGGGDVRLGDLWVDSKVVLVWLRHYR